ncbi:MAG: MFS transporter [Dehalococcoidales bacterium]|nr:MFS transporter [Dehalococcoidales bacterium]
MAPLRHRGFRLLWLSSLSWYFGRWMDVLVTGWVTLQITDSAWLVAMIGFYRSIPVPIFGAFAGAIADRVDRRLLVIATETINALTALSIALLFMADRLEYWHLAVANLLLGFAWSIEWPSRRAIIPDLVGRELIMPAVVLDSISMNFNRTLGPLLGGALLATLDIPGCYLLLALLYAGGLVPLLLLRLPASTRAKSASALRFLGEGLGFCVKQDVVRGILLITVLMNCFYFPYVQLLPVIARDVFHVGPVALGFLSAADGIGSIIGAFILVSWKRLRRHGLVFVASSVGATAALFAFSVSPIYGLGLAMLILGGVLHSGFTTFQSTVILGAVSDSLRGRVLGVLTLAIGSSPAGMLLMGGIAGALSASWALGISGAAGVVLNTAAATISPGLVAHAAKPAEPTAAMSTKRSVASSE